MAGRFASQCTQTSPFALCHPAPCTVYTTHLFVCDRDSPPTASTCPHARFPLVPSYTRIHISIAPCQNHCMMGLPGEGAQQQQGWMDDGNDWHAPTPGRVVRIPPLGASSPYTGCISSGLWCDIRPHPCTRLCQHQTQHSRMSGNRVVLRVPS